MAIRTQFWQTMILAAAGTALLGAPAHAAPKVALGSAVYVEKAQGDDVRRLEPASQLSRGDRVVTIVTWRRLGGPNGGNGGGFTVTNPLPRSVYFQRSANDDEEVSADGGRSWGRIGALRYGARLATPEDVTHLRWRVTADRAAAGRGQIAYSGIVR